MKIITSGRNMKVSDRMREQIELKLEKFEKFFNSDIEVHVTLSHQKTMQILEITIPLKNGAVFRAEESSEDMFKSLDLAVDKLSKQIKKHKTNIHKRYQTHDSIRFDMIPESENKNEVESKIVRTKSFIMKPMDPEEAVLQMELVGHNFFIFLNGETDNLNVVYVRKDGNYGVIEPE
ncbi:MAG: ribosome-associated translation inhibitor RaiA [Clostridiales bacterium]|nr:ribosome-associated translation inhibitor RaiA [Clostridiales bacterium]